MISMLPSFYSNKMISKNGKSTPMMMNITNICVELIGLIKLSHIIGILIDSINGGKIVSFIRNVYS